MYNGMTGPPVEPSPGHYMDIQMIIENMENLSGWLQQNREEWAEIQDGLARVERLQVWTISETGCLKSPSLEAEIAIHTRAIVDSLMGIAGPTRSRWSIVVAER